MSSHSPGTLGSFYTLSHNSPSPAGPPYPLSRTAHSQYLGGAVLGLGEWTPRPFPTLSPKKSVGGYLFALVFAGATCWFLFRPRHPVEVVAILLIGFVGDVAA